MANQQGNRVENAVLVTLTGTVTKGHWVLASGVEAGSGVLALGVALEDGVSGQKISVQIAGIASVICGAAGATAGAPAMCDGSGLSTDRTTTLVTLGQFLQTATSGQSVQVHMWASN